MSKARNPLSGRAALPRKALAALAATCLLALPSFAGQADWPQYWAHLPAEAAAQRTVLDDAFAAFSKGDLTADQARKAEQVLRPLLEGRSHGANVLAEARAWMFLGELVLQQGKRVSQGYEDERRGLALFERALPGDDPELAATLSSHGNTLRMLQRYPQALELQERALAIREKALGPEHPDTVKSLNKLAGLYQDIAQPEQALPLYQRALAISEKANGQAHSNTATLLNNLALLYQTMGRYEQALPLYQRALAISEKAEGPEHPSTGTSLNNLAGLYQTMGRYEQALPLYQRALAISEKAEGPEHPSTGTSLNNLAGLYQDMGRYEQALPLYQRALAISEKAEGAEHPSTGTRLNNLAVLYQAMGRYEQALPLYQRALAISGKAEGPEHPSTGTSLNNLAELYQDMGRYEQALPLYQRALAISEKAEGPEHPSTGTRLNNLAVLYQAMDRYEQALPLYQRALAISEKAEGPEHPSTGRNLNNLAELYRAMGRYEQALPLLQRALAISEKAEGPEHPSTGRNLNNLAALYYAMGSYKQALPLLQRALTISEKSEGPEHPSTGTSQNNLASLYQAMGRYEQALPLLQRALAISETAEGPEHPNTGRNLNNLALQHLTMGRYEQALPLYQWALRIYATHALSPVEKAQTADNLATLHASLNHPELAIFYGKQAVNGYQALRGHYQQMDKALQQSFLKKNEGIYQRLYGWLVDQGRLGEAEQVLAMLKQEELDEFTQRSRQVAPIRAQAPFAGAEIELAKEEALLAEEGRVVWQKLGPLDAAWRQGRAKFADFALPTEDEAERVRLNAALSQLNERYRAYTTKLSQLLSQQKFDPEELQRLASRSEEYRRILGQLERSSGQPTVLLQYVEAPDKLYIMRHDSKRSAPLSVAVSSKEISNQVQALRAALRNPMLDPRPAAKALYDWLIAPVQADLAAHGTQHLMISQTGALRYVPMAALYSGQHWLVEDYSLSMFSETTMDQLKDLPANWRLAGFGLTQAVPNFAALPGVRDEFDGIKRSGLSAQVSYDENFTATRVRSSIEGGQSPVVHVASHFYLAPGTNAQSFLVLGDGSPMPLADIGGLTFDGIDLLTLSACETALSGTADATGKEVESLGAMVQRKGAKAVMASLWKVADQSTAQLMQSFYTLRVKDKLTKAQALRQAQLDMVHEPPQATDKVTQRSAKREGISAVKPNTDPALAGYRHPYHWAPFILMGNWL